MSARAPLPRYIPPPTTFLLSRSGLTYGTKPLPNKHWNLVRTNVQNNRAQVGSRNEHDFTGYGNGAKWALNRVDAPQITKHNDANRQNGRQKSNEVQSSRLNNDNNEELQVMENQQLHYAQPDLSRIFDEVDKSHEIRGNGKQEGATPETSNPDDSSSREENGTLTAANGNYDDDVDWQKKEERDSDKKYDLSRNRPRNNSVYDPEITKIRAQEIDQTFREAGEKDKDMCSLGDEAADFDMAGKSRRLNKSKRPKMATKGTKQKIEHAVISDEEEEKMSLIDKEGDALGEVESKKDEDSERNELDTKQDDVESKNENEFEKEGGGKEEKPKFKNLNDAIKKCTSKFAEKLLDVLEQHKNDCSIRFDDICKKHKKKSSEPIFSSYSCENGETTDSFKDTVRKKVRGLVGGVYTKACEGAGAIRDAAEELIDEIKPQDDGSWSTIGGESGVRCVPHYDNRIEDHTVYVCSCCFNEVIERDAHVNVKYFEPDFGCCKPKIVSRSFENRPYFCEKLLSSMSKKRRSCFLKIYGKKHQMRGGVHCISVIPSMEKEYLEKDGKTEGLNKVESYNGDDGSIIETQQRE